MRITLPILIIPGAFITFGAIAFLLAKIGIFGSIKGVTDVKSGLVYNSYQKDGRTHYTARPIRN